MSSTDRAPRRLAGLAWALLLWAALPVRAETGAPTVDPVLLPFSGLLTDRRTEVSGLAWLDDRLFILPEDPARWGRDGGLLFFLVPRAQILDYLNGRRTAPLDPEPLACPAGVLRKPVDGFDGLEAVAIAGDRIHLAIEAKARAGMEAHLVTGRIDRAGDGPRVELTRLTPIPLATDIFNVGEESLVIAGDRVLTMGEANGRNVNPQPRAAVFDAEGNALGALPFPAIEYRVTDATALDRDGCFWVINYFYPADASRYKPAADPESGTLGLTGCDNPQGCVERLLELRLTPDDRIERTATPPINLAPLGDGHCHNWEGLVRLGDRGFLLMSDKHPGTLLAFVANPFAPREEE